MIWRNFFQWQIISRFSTLCTAHCTVWKNEKFSLTEFFSSNQQFSNLFILVKPLHFHEIFAKNCALQCVEIMGIISHAFLTKKICEINGFIKSKSTKALIWRNIFGVRESIDFPHCDTLHNIVWKNITRNSLSPTK